MPSFGRLSKHSNRSQQAVAEQLSTGSGSGVGSGSGPAPSPGAAQAQTHGITAGPGVVSAPGAAGHADSLAESAPQSALSSAAARTSSDLDTFVDAHSRPPPQAQQLLHHQHKIQQHQTQHQLQQPSFPPSHLFNPPHSGAGIPQSLQSSNSGVGGSSAFDGHQSQSSLEFVDAAAAGQRYGAPLHPQQHQQQHRHPPQEYGITTGSIDDLPAAVGYHHQQQQQPPQQSTPSQSPAPEKRSTRKLIKGIFGSGRHHDTPVQQQQNQPATQTGPYDNTAGLARRPSKRVSNPPDLKNVNVPQATQLPPDQDWQPQGPYAQQTSPLLREAADVDEYLFYAHGSNISPQIQNSRILLGHGNGNSKSNSNSINSNNGALQLSTEHLEASAPYEQDYQPPDHPPPHQQLQSQQTPPPLQVPQPRPLQRQGTIRIPEQQSQYESQQPQQIQASSFDQQSYQARQQAQQQGANWPPGTSQRQHQSQAGDNRITTSQLASGQQLQNAETISQLSHDSPVTETDPRSTFQAVQPPPALVPGSAAVQDISASNTAPGPDQSTMTPSAPGGGSQSSRADKTLRGQLDSLSQSPGYHRQSKNSISLNAMPPSSGAEQGRNSPQSSERDPELEKQFKDLLTKYKNVKRLYFDGKAQIEQLSGQVEQLQNAVANQRMSQSRTAWDDNEYSTRFNRLNGAINNLAFNIRKDWRSLPPWLENFVSADALKTGKQEMTAVGRAVISRWLVEELFNCCFHPALDTQLSAQLKGIELSIRGNSHTIHSQEEYDALTTKVVNWRMATLDGLQQRLNSSAAAENRVMLMNKATENLMTYLDQYLNKPSPPGVEGCTSVIAELAVAIAANLPLESRDVAIMYPLPGDMVQAGIMEVEKAGLPSLDGRTDHDDSDSDDEEANEMDQAGKKQGLAKRVRFAGFVALEVRGRQVLMKAPVWTM